MAVPSSKNNVGVPVMPKATPKLYCSMTLFSQEDAFIARLKQAFGDLNNINTL